jgi:hypothetical protein
MLWCISSLHELFSNQDVLSVAALMAGNSQACGPNRGIVIKVPTLFEIGFENVQRVSFPSDDNQAGLMVVRPE